MTKNENLSTVGGFVPTLESDFQEWKQDLTEWLDIQSEVSCLIFSALRPEITAEDVEAYDSFAQPEQEVTASLCELRNQIKGVYAMAA